MPTTLNLVTGPSRTADIEQTIGPVPMARARFILIPIEAKSYFILKISYQTFHGSHAETRH
jgi:hypothetical protein